MRGAFFIAALVVGLCCYQQGKADDLPLLGVGTAKVTSGGGSVTATFITDAHDLTNTSDTKTFSATACGTASAGRRIAVGVMTDSVSTSTTISGVTLDNGDGSGAVAMTSINSQKSLSDSGHFGYSAVFERAAASGNSTCNIVVTLTNSISNLAGLGIVVYSITGSSGASSANDGGINTGGGIISKTLTLSAGSCAIGIGEGIGFTGLSRTWSGLTADSPAVYLSNDSFNSLSNAAASKCSLSGSTPISITLSGFSADAASFAAWSP